MPKYRFHVRDGMKILDTDGIDLPDLFSARLYAIQLTSDLLKQYKHEVWIDEDWKIVVTDERNIALFVLHISALFLSQSQRQKVS